jgi:peptidoglycan/xylan/chitin deacetylase (PgdA/CDA1 family)
MSFEKNKMWNGKKKALTFSFDDGVSQDIRLIEILNRYGLKATFNINSELLDKPGKLERNGKTVSHDKVRACDLRKIYEGHEIAAHTLTHPNLTKLGEEEIIRQVEEDRKNLSRLCGYDVVGMAYPCGGVNNDERVAEIIKNNTGIKYARTITSTHSFAEQDNLFRFNPSVYYIEENLEDIVESFLTLETEDPSLLYIWGHSYEMDAEYITWEKLEKICARLAGRNEIFYGTNREVFGV